MIVGGINSACGQIGVRDPWGQTIDIGSQGAWDGLPISNTAFEFMIGWPASNMTNAECQSVLRNIVTASNISDGLIGVAGPGIGVISGTANLSALNANSFANCGGHFTLQFSIS